MIVSNAYAHHTTACVCTIYSLVPPKSDIFINCAIFHVVCVQEGGKDTHSRRRGAVCEYTTQTDKIVEGKCGFFDGW